MPNIPIDFTTGYYVDSAVKTANRDVVNCWPETNAQNQTTILRSCENYQEQEGTSTKNYGNSIIVGDTIYGIEGTGQFFSIDINSTTYTAIGSLPSAIFVPYRLATNGDSIVMVNYQSTTKTHDFYYDIGTATLATITSKDADYSGFEKAIDVVYKDGYYLFITKNTLFHGDNFISTGDGLAFDPLSFAVIPAEAGDGRGVEVANSQVYAFTAKATLLYQTVATTPFSFSRSVGFDIDLGLTDPCAKITFEDSIFLLGKSSGTGASAFILSGQSYTQVSNSELDALLRSLSYRAVMSTYRANGHRMITMRSHLAQGTATDPLVLDYTETQIKGVPVWHRRTFSASGVWPIYEYFSTSESTSSFDAEGFAMGIRNSGFKGTTLYQVKNNEIIGDPSEFDMAGLTRSMTYTFPAIRAGGDPFFIKSIRMMWSGSVQNVELFVTTDNNSFSSLGSFDLTTSTTKVAEWRRVNRFSDQAGFKIVFDSVNSSDNVTLIGGRYTA